MMGGGQDYVENPNANYMNGRGFWAFYVLLIVHFHLTLLTLPIITFTVPWVRIIIFLKTSQLTLVFFSVGLPLM